MKNKFAWTLAVVPPLVGMAITSGFKGNVFGATYCGGAATMIALWVIVDLASGVQALLKKDALVNNKTTD